MLSKQGLELSLVCIHLETKDKKYTAMFIT